MQACCRSCAALAAAERHYLNKAGLAAEIGEGWSIRICNERADSKTLQNRVGMVNHFAQCQSFATLRFVDQRWKLEAQDARTSMSFERIKEAVDSVIEHTT